jgi:hypothetical protein
VALIVGAIVQLANISSGRVSLALSLAVFFGAYGALLVVGGIALHRSVPWPRGPVLLSQLIMLGLAWGLRDQPAAAIVLAIVAVIAIAGLVHPASIQALEDARARSRDQDSSSD